MSVQEIANKYGFEKRYSSRFVDAKEHRQSAEAAIELFDAVFGKQAEKEVEDEPDSVSLAIGEVALAGETECGVAFKNVPVSAVMTKTPLANGNFSRRIAVRNDATSEEIGVMKLSHVDLRPIRQNRDNVRNFSSLLQDVIERAGVKPPAPNPPE